MTRELKLALIVGFSLVLFVTVLVSDHLSRARRAELPRIAEPTSSLTIMPPAAEIKPAADRAVTPTETPAPRHTPLPGDPGSPFGPSTPTIAGAQNPAQPQPGDKVALGPLVTPVERGILPQDGAQIDNPILIDLSAKPQPSAATQTAGDPAPGAEPRVTEPPAPVAPKVDEYTIEEGDTLYELSRRFYKDARHWKALQAYNRDRLTKDGQPRAGASIRVPSLDVLLGRPATQVARAELPPMVEPRRKAEPTNPQPVKPQPVKPATKTYKVQKNDTLTGIAQRLLGSQKRVNDLIKANPSIDPDNMKIGTELRIPA